MPTITNRAVAFSTPWFELIAKHVDDNPAPHYTLKPADYVTVIASDRDGRFLMVRQYRPVVEGYTLELPSGLVDPGETPDACARRELVEETGHEAAELELIGDLIPDTGRLGNRMFCYVARNVRALDQPTVLDDGIRLVKYAPEDFLRTFSELRCNHALNFAAVMLAVCKGHLSLPSS